MLTVAPSALASATLHLPTHLDTLVHFTPSHHQDIRSGLCHATHAGFSLTLLISTLNN